MKMQLLKAKIQKDQKGMILDMEDSLILGGNKKEKGTTYSPIPHDDLITSFQRLKPALLETLKLGWVFSELQPTLFTTTEEHNANKVLKDRIWSGYDKVCACVKVTGFSVSGEGANRGIKVTGTINDVGFASQRIVLGRDTIGIEEELESDLKECIDAVHAYLGGKHGESPNLFNQPELNPDGEERELTVEDLERMKKESDEGKAPEPVKSKPKRSSPLIKAGGKKKAAKKK